MRGSKFSALCLCLLIVGCQSDASIRSKPPTMTYESSKTLDAAVTCLIPSLGKAYSNAAISNFRFVAQIISPNNEYDIVPTDGFVNGHYIFTVNVKRNGPKTTISLFKGQPMMLRLTEAMTTGIRNCL